MTRSSPWLWEQAEPQLKTHPPDRRPRVVLPLRSALSGLRHFRDSGLTAALCAIPNWPAGRELDYLAARDLAARLNRHLGRLWSLGILPGSPECLPRSVAIAAGLWRAGARTELILGLRQMDSGREPSPMHAWLEFEGKPLMTPERELHSAIASWYLGSTQFQIAAGADPRSEAAAESGLLRPGVFVAWRDLHGDAYLINSVSNSIARLERRAAAWLASILKFDDNGSYPIHLSRRHDSVEMVDHHQEDELRQLTQQLVTGGWLEPAPYKPMGA